ncbi:MAG: hypothetical protein MSH47_05060, partial [Bacteroidales bacterium]|nr:hypothetical protein [Bacteroidales bacterium]MDY5194617.1 hypothetical protein [Candidatus Aphodosoma sp.]
MHKIFTKSIYLLFLFLSINVLTNAQNTPLPYFCGFETSADTAGWMFKKRASTQCEYVIGRAIHRTGAKSLYVSADGGATAS